MEIEEEKSFKQEDLNLEYFNTERADEKYI